LALIICVLLVPSLWAALTSSNQGGIRVNLTKIDNPDPVLASTQLNYTITINITGLPSNVSNISNLTLIERYPDQVIFVSASPAAASGNTTFVIGNFSTNVSFSVNISVFVTNTTDGFNLSNIANITYQNASGVTLNLSVVENTTVQNPPLRNVSNISITKTDNQDPVTQGSQFSYTITVTSSGNGTAYNVTVVDVYPAEVIFVSASPAALTGTNNTFVLGNLSASSSSAITVTVTVPSTVPVGVVLNNTANASFQNETSQVAVNRTATQATTVSAVAASQGGGSSSGGGGGVSSARSMTTDTATYSMRRSERVTFHVNTVLHTITILSILSDSVHLRVSSTPQDFTIKKGNSQTVDVNLDGKMDLRLTVVDISYSSATLKVELLKEACVESWSCDAWSACENGQQTRTCFDAKNCGTTALKPAESQACTMPVPEPPQEPAQPTVPEPAVQAEMRAEPLPRELPIAEEPRGVSLQNAFYGIALLALVVLGVYWYQLQHKKKHGHQ